MTPFIPNAGYQVIVLSGNAFLWLGLHSMISAAVTPRPEMYWINSVDPHGLTRLQERLLDTPAAQNWLIFTDAAWVSDINAWLRSERVRVVADNLSLAQLSRCFSDTTFSFENAATLSYQEMRVCMLLHKGFSPVRIAKILNKSPKTIYTHKRNAMNKFCCHSLAEFHRKLCLLDAQSFSL
ncbi:helix-turn-helix transcriptional regulator [Enterobacter genomosp. O]|uniref:Helix-turn-helix transcriptional regulator n=2 Tax=Enterobacter TaxID=547 RepID=A0A0X4EDK2_9ENTR|nr:MULTISPECIES: helix-turn-helix transcriptional regulator [Enterobacter cloacae complex]KUQ79786.1 helix-turn-helix transcriptional regulator [Enterobacter genomosp. O]KZQ34169.1 helix-turn-helix transcriptional regulator [Enterobacter genomosp. O]MCM7110504.1 helix-turn-helix transcriptional regulator [Enterobacter cloacae]